MKSHIKCILLALSGLSMFSCQNITEEITLNADGSGKYEVYSDNVQTAKKAYIETLVPKDQRDKIDMDSLNLAMEERIWQEFPHEVDSIMDISTNIPDSLKDDPEEIAMLEKAEVFVSGGIKKGYLNTGIRYRFDNMSDLSQFLAYFKQSQTQILEDNRRAPIPGLANIESTISFTYTKNRLKRDTEMIKGIVIDKEKMGLLNMLMDGAKLKTIIHLPAASKKIKGAHFKESSLDKKTIIFEYDLMAFLSGEVDTDFDIKLKRP